MDAKQEAHRERGELADFLQGLSEGQWATPSLCAGWTVQDVVAHVVSYDELTRWRLGARALRSVLLPDRMNALGVTEYATRSPAQLVSMLREPLRPSALVSAMGGAIALVDGLIHHQDIRRPLGQPRKIPHDRLRFVLNTAWTAPLIRGFWHARGVRLVAEDVGWSRGRGPEVRGPAEAVLMTAAGRRGVARELTGPGVDVLTARLG